MSDKPTLIPPTHKSKSGLRRAFKTNRQMESEGVWFDMREAANEDGSIPGFLIVRVGITNMQHSLALEDAVKQFGKQELTRIESAEATRKAFIKTGVQDWRNVQDDNGNTLPFDRALLAKLYEDMPDIYFEHVTFANERNNFKDQKELQAVK